MKITQLFNKPKIIAIIADRHTGKSNLIYHTIDELQKAYSFKLYAYGLRAKVNNVTKVHSTKEIEAIRNSMIIIDEFFTLFDLNDRKIKKQIESTIRLIAHNNNILVLCGLPNNFKKFISAAVDVMIFKKITLDDLINGSSVKKEVMAYEGEEKGNTLLNIPVDKALIFDGTHYYLIDVPYMKEQDTKARNIPIFVPKSVPKNVQKKCEEDVNMFTLLESPVDEKQEAQADLKRKYGGNDHEETRKSNSTPEGHSKDSKLPDREDKPKG